MYDTSANDLGRLRAMRTGLTGHAFAQALGIRYWRLRRLEYGRSLATDEEIKLLSAALNLPEGELRVLVKVKPHPPPTED